MNLERSLILLQAVLWGIDDEMNRVDGKYRVNGYIIDDYAVKIT